MGCNLHATHLLDIKYKHGQFSFFCHTAVKLAQRSCSAVSWICKNLFTEKLLLFIDSVKVLIFHIDFTTDLQIFRVVFQFLFNI